MKQTEASQWVSTRKLANELGVSISFLWKNRESLFTQGVHWRLINPHAWRPTYRWHVGRCQQLMDLNQPEIR